MKKIILLAAALCLVIAGIASATVVGTQHDMSGTIVGISDTTQVCVFCHHPHVGQTTRGTELIWNLDDMSPTTFAVYDSASFDGTTAGDVDSGAPQSFLCMACHDGTIGANSLLADADAGANDITASFDVGTDAPYVGSADALADLGSTLVDDHPVNFTYDADLVSRDGGLEDVTSGEVIGASTAVYPLYGASNNLMQCATCHNVHAGSTTGDTSASSDVEFMRGDTAASEICVDCHTDK